MSSNHIWGSYKNFANLASLSATVFSLRLTCEKETFHKLEVSRLYSSIIWPKATKQGEFETRCLSIISESPSKTTSCSPSSMEKEMALSYMPKLPHPPPWVVKQCAPIMLLSPYLLSHAPPLLDLSIPSPEK